MTNLIRARIALLAVTVTSVMAVGLTSASAASAFFESYGGFEVGNNGFVQSAGAHTFALNFGGGHTTGRLACQLFNSKGANNVEHGNGACSVFYGGGEFVWARVYNESGASEVIAGEAET